MFDRVLNTPLNTSGKLLPIPGIQSWLMEERLDKDFPIFADMFRNYYKTQTASALYRHSN